MAERAHRPLTQVPGRPAARVSTAEVRECPRHGPIEFHHCKNGRTGTRWRCKRCAAEAVTRRHQKVKRMLVAEAGGACVVCGYKRCIFNLHFHHVDPTTKLFAVNMGYGKSLATFRAEASKCVLVCANCHGEIETGMVESPPAGAKFGVWSPMAT